MSINTNLSTPRLQDNRNYDNAMFFGGFSFGIAVAAAALITSVAVAAGCFNGLFITINCSFYGSLAGVGLVTFAVGACLKAKQQYEAKKIQ